jgi:uncharacterized membrane protein YeaQ/YmgE (transglycosylase-associated protein family)
MRVRSCLPNEARRYAVAFILMVVVGLTAGQLIWALMPETQSIGWVSVCVFGVLGSLAGGVLMSFVVNHELFPTRFVGSMTGTLVLLAVLHVVRARTA